MGEFFTLMGEEAMEQIKEDIAKIEEYKQTSEQLKEEIWEDRMESNRIQTAVVDADPEVNVEEATAGLRDRIAMRKKKTKEIKHEYEEFLKDQKQRYDILLKEKRASAEKLRLQKIKEEEERKRKEEEARLKAIADAEEKKKKEEEKARQLEIAMMKGDINKILEKEKKNMTLMRKEAERIEMKQREIEILVEKRHEVHIGPGELKQANFLDSMHQEFTDFSERMQNKEDTIVVIGRLVMDSKQDVKELKAMADTLQGDMECDWKRLETLGKDTDFKHDTQQKLLTSQLLEIKRREERKKKEEEEKEKLRLLKIAQEKERKRKEEEARLKAIADAEEKKKKEEEKARQLEIAMMKG